MPPNNRENSAIRVTANSIKGDREILQAKVLASKQHYDEEKERLKSIEGKASMFITSSGFLGTVLIGTSNILLSQKDADVWFMVSMVICLLFFVVYMACTVINSIKALERSTYNRPDPTPMIDISGIVDYDKQSIADLLNSTILNQDTTNLKMDYVVVAQRHFKRLILSVLAFVFVLLAYVFNKTKISFFSCFYAVKEEVATWPLNLWFMLVSSILTIISLIIGGFALCKIQRHCRREKEVSTQSLFRKG